MHIYARIRIGVPLINMFLVYLDCWAYPAGSGDHPHRNFTSPSATGAHSGT